MKILDRIFKKKTDENTIIEETQEVVIKKNNNTITSKKTIAVIDSKYIQNDIKQSFDKVLAEFSLIESKETNIEVLQEQLESFKVLNSNIYDKANKLNQLGFNNTPSAKKLLTELKQQEETINTKIDGINKDIQSKNELKELIAEYSIKFPGYKFIDKETMINIMKKYTLVLGDTSLYCKEIPDKALNLISGFSKYIINDKKYVYQQRSRYTYVTDNGLYIISDKRLKHDHSNHNSHILDINISNLKMIAPQSHFKIPTISIKDSYENTSKIIPIATVDVNNKEFVYNIEKLNKIVKSNREVLDPIAVLEVKRGYIIIDAWDEEADIPEIQNTLLN